MIIIVIKVTMLSRYVIIIYYIEIHSYVSTSVSRVYK